MQTIAGAAVSMFLLAGCVQLGPRALESGRPQYNIAVQQTEAQQLLLNIVRQRYNDPLMFLDVTSISSGYGRGMNASILGVLGTGNGTGTGAVGGNLGETPNIFYAPNTGEKFAKQMLTPLDLNTVALLLQAGWSIERVFLLLAESVNDIYNRPVANDSGERYARFLSLADSLRDLQRDGFLTVGLERSEAEQGTALVLMIAPDAAGRPSYRQVCETIGTECNGAPLRMRQAFGAPADSTTVALATRSLFSAIYHISRQVDVPAEDISTGVASPSYDLAERTPAATEALRQLFHVRSSKDEPERAAIKVNYRDAWFYIDDTDQDTKTTFALLSMLITLQAGSTGGVMPLITIPSG